MTRPLISYYGDDFTGSTDVMEALAGNGVETVLFVRQPDDVLLSRFSSARAFGLAGTSRSETPDWMDTHLSAAFAWLKRLDAGFCHYKVCSTFDSAPGIGSIGRAIELGRKAFGEKTVPLVVGAPQIRRYTAFGQLFAAYQGKNYRIDRHPVMSRHPVTPMHEADILRHLEGQTALSSAMIDVVELMKTDASALASRELATNPGILLADVLDAGSQAAAGRLLVELGAKGSQFVCGSSGVEYALIEAWREKGVIGAKPVFADAGPVERIAVVSGSVSPTTERQIRHAVDNGFVGIGVDPIELSGCGAEAEMERAISEATVALSTGKSPLIYSALGPGADKGAALGTADGARHRLGQNLGRILYWLVKAHGLKRAVIAGGDTSSHALGEMQVSALTLKMPLPQTPGSPLSTTHGSDPATDGLQIALKGGQVGLDDYFSMIRAGRPN